MGHWWMIYQCPLPVSKKVEFKIEVDENISDEHV